MARILIVDDESDFRMMLGKVLAMEGHQVLFAANGWEALLVLDGDGVDLCIVDVMMPGMDGPTLLRILRNASKHKFLPVIVVSVLDMGETTSRLGSVPVDGILKKGQRLIEELLERIEMVLGKDTTPGDQSWSN
ncbi:MAG TPA: response regulator [Tepidisphaeraceae bacterium]|jgi:CheY-like chemotaxis protein|nr:response regulator [Tepidisphaeraceae bacterium]